MYGRTEITTTLKLKIMETLQVLSELNLDQKIVLTGFALFIIVTSVFTFIELRNMYKSLKK